MFDRYRTYLDIFSLKLIFILYYKILYPIASFYKRSCYKCFMKFVVLLWFHISHWIINITLHVNFRYTNSRSNFIVLSFGTRSRYHNIRQQVTISNKYILWWVMLFSSCSFPNPIGGPFSIYLMKPTNVSWPFQ